MISKYNAYLLSELAFQYVEGDKELDAITYDILVSISKEDNISFEEVKEYFGKCLKESKTEEL